MMGVKSSGQLRRYAMRLREAPKHIQRIAASDLRQRLLRLIDDCFARRADPHGKPWPPPKDGHAPPMQRTGDLRRGFRVAVVASGAGLALQVSNVEDYARWLQQGTATMDARLMVPTQAGGLPPLWKQAFDEAYARAIGVWYASAGG